jgi:pilus assembly protein CpaB
MVILSQGNDRIARVVVNNVLILAADTNRDQASANKGDAIRSSVVTVLVSPEDAEKISLAATTGQIMLTLRNPLDVAPAASKGTRTSGLFSDAGSPAPASETPRPARRPTAVAPPPPPPPAPTVYVVETIRAAKRSEDPIK